MTIFEPITMFFQKTRKTTIQKHKVAVMRTCMQIKCRLSPAENILVVHHDKLSKPNSHCYRQKIEIILA